MRETMHATGLSNLLKMVLAVLKDCQFDLMGLCNKDKSKFIIAITYFLMYM